MRLVRNCGLFSNLTQMQSLIVDRLFMGGEVDFVELILEEYVKDIDVFPILFKGIDNNITFCEKEIQYLKEKKRAWEFGIIENYVDLLPFHKLQQKYLRPAELVVDKVNELRKKLPEKYTFLWYRGTDKVTESTLPPMEVIHNIMGYVDESLGEFPLVVRSDHGSFLQSFNPGREWINLSHANSNEAEYLDMKSKVGIEEALAHLVELLALTKIAADAHCYVATNSNINGFVLQQRCNFDRVLVYKNSTEFLFNRL